MSALGRVARIGVRLAALGLAALSGGCIDYLARRDTLLLESGEAVQANIAQQVIDPWPAHARRVNRDVDGARLQAGIERYRSPRNTGNGAFGPGEVPVGPSTAPGAGLGGGLGGGAGGGLGGGLVR